MHAALREEGALAVAREVGDHVARIGILDHGAHRHAQHDVVRAFAVLVAPAAVLAGLGAEDAGVAEIDERVEVGIGHCDNAAPAAAIAAVGSAARHRLFSAERGRAIAALAADHEEHELVVADVRDPPRRRRLDVEEPAGAEDALLAVGADNALGVAEGRAVGHRGHDRGASRGAVFGVHAVEIGLERAAELALGQPVDPVQLVRPVHSVGREVPLPAAQMGDLLRAGQLLPAAQQFVLGFAPLGDVAAEGAKSPAVALSQRRDGQLDGELAPVAMERRDLDAAPEDRPLAGRENPGEAGAVCVAMRGGNDGVGDGAAHGFGGRPAEGALGGGIPRGDHAAVVHRDHRVERGVQDCAEARFGGGHEMVGIALGRTDSSCAP